jgi:uncharacterized membrane protein
MTDEVKTEEPKVEEKKPEGWKPGDGVKAVGGAVVDNPEGAVVGGLVGTIFLPGIGTAIGVGVGAWWQKKRRERRERAEGKK